jgi:hypothetical protein
MNRAAPLVAGFMLLAAAGCSKEPAPPAESGGKAEGEVLGGTISDAMIPLEQLTSEAPLAPRQGPAPADLDAEQPVVTPIEGVEGAAPAEAAEAEPAAPAPAPSP